MARPRYYTPQLERPLVTALYHAAKARRIPMTRLASLLLREGLQRLELGSGEGGYLVSEGRLGLILPPKRLIGSQRCEEPGHFGRAFSCGRTTKSELVPQIPRHARAASRGH